MLEMVTAKASIKEERRRIMRDARHIGIVLDSANPSNIVHESTRSREVILL
jgi:hypothetical protein